MITKVVNESRNGHELTFALPPAKVGVFSDVHANLGHLEALLNDMVDREVEEIWCLGDFADGSYQAGYGGTDPLESLDPKEVCRLVFGICDVVLGGNHELGLVENQWKTKTTQWALQAGAAAQALGGEWLERLKRLPPFHERPDLDVFMMHGSTRDLWHGYAAPFTPDLKASFQDRQESVLLTGHTHEAMFASWARDEISWCLPIKLGLTYNLPPRCCLNPGFAGSDDGARWLELGLHPARTATWRRTRVTNP
jgi:predicted phosphodiesterase